jgi:hypothetical protein
LHSFSIEFDVQSIPRHFHISLWRLFYVYENRRKLESLN